MPVATRIDLRVNKRAKTLIEKAAARAGQSVSDFAKDTLLSRSRHVLQQHQTVLSDRDRDIFLAMLDADATANAALKKAVKTYVGTFGR